MATKRKILRSREIEALNERRELLGIKRYKNGSTLSTEDVILVTEMRRLESEGKFTLDRKIVQTKDYCGLKAGRVGWVTSTWPKTRILFEDGSEPDISFEFSDCLEGTSEYCNNINDIRMRIVSASKARRIQRKSTY